jgi:hypothetical protein
MNEERRRLDEARRGVARWKRWGPYVSDRQWGTVREDYSDNGDAWSYFPFAMAASRAYRWGEDALGGFCDDDQRLCLGIALWNGQDSILKERLFGLTNSQGNHGEDVKELYYHLDATPTSSYARMLYKYPQRSFPYELLVEENARRDRRQPEFELIDTGIFDDNRYFDVFIEYAKASPEDVLMRVAVHNRGPEPAPLALLLQAWFRNTWSWTPGAPRPAMQAINAGEVAVHHAKLGDRLWYLDGPRETLFCDNDTNSPRLFGARDVRGYFKDAFNDYVVHGAREAVNPERRGTKAAGLYQLLVPAGSAVSVRARMTPAAKAAPFDDFDAIFVKRQSEADAFYEELEQGIKDEDARRVHRQALAGLLWTKQYYHYDIPLWLDGDPAQPPPPTTRRNGRNSDWRHLNNADVISMPDKWEYPWYASWDLAFQTLPMALVDADFAKEQLVLFTREWFLHPNGQLPAYEWGFSDVNPPVHAWAAWRVFQIDRRHSGGKGDFAFLERIFHKLLLNFTWWVNRKDARGRNIFQGGFLGLDNIGVFDRNATLPGGDTLDQADATSWMAMFSLNLMRIALELALHNPVYQDIATKFFEHFLTIAEAMNNMGGAHSGVGLWDEQDEFYYDHINEPAGRIIPLKVRSIVGLIPLFAVETLEPECLKLLPDFDRRLRWFLKYRPDLAALVSRWHEPGRGDRRLLSLLRGHRVKALLRRMLDESEFLSPFGVRSLSRYHLEHPYTLNLDGQSFRVSYLPAESDSGMFGGNSNWRGPIWFPINYLIIEALQKFHHYYGDDFKVECPTHSGRYLTIEEVSIELSHRLTRLFLRDDKGARPVFGANARMQTDPHFRDNLLFYEYFDGDTGRGAGASHQTGWTALVAKLLQPRRRESVACAVGPAP